MREFNDQKCQDTLVSEEQSIATRTSLHIDTVSGHSSRSTLRLAPPVQDTYLEKSNTGDGTTFPSHGCSGEVNGAAVDPSETLRREVARERVYQEKMKLAQAAHHDHHVKSNIADITTSNHQPDEIRREEALEIAYQHKMELAQASHHVKSNVADITKSPSYGSGEMKVAAVQEKMNLSQANPYRPTQGSSAPVLTLAVGAESTTHIPVLDWQDKKMQAFVLQDESRFQPAVSLAQRDDWSSTKAGLKSTPDDYMKTAKRAYAENTKNQQQLLTTFAPVMPQQDQRTSHTFDGEGLCLAPARAVSVDTTMMPSAHDVAQCQGPCHEYSDQGWHDEKARMMEGSQGNSSGQQFPESVNREKEATHAGNQSSLSYLPTRMQVDNNSNRARGTQDLTLAKNALLIDPRAAPLDHTTNVEQLSVIEAISASGMEQQLTASYVSATASNTSWEPPSRRMRTPAEGYTVHAGNKGPHDYTTAPGAIAVAQRALGARPGPRNQGDSTARLDVLDESFTSYSAPAQETNRSTRGNALSTSGVPGSMNAQSAWVGYREESSSNLPRARAPLFGTRVSSSSLGGKIDEKRGISATVICIRIGILVLVIALGTGLGVGLGGNDDPSPNIATPAPTLPHNISYFQSLVEDFYNSDGGLVFEDTKSPQYQALVWLASDAQSVSLGVERIRTLYALAVFYYSTNGDDFLSLSTWSERLGFLNSTLDNICKWNNGDRVYVPKGLWCDDAETKVERLYYSTNNLVGVIPEEIGMLKDLQYLLVAGNRLSSTLPESLFALSSLKGVDLNLNSFTGVLPSTFYKATSLEILQLGANTLHGPFSLDHIVESGACPLQLVILTGNTFSGTFPLESIAANCTDMTTININDCGVVVEGNIPTFGLEQLTVLDLTKTELGGSIPDEISRLQRLQQLKADYNALTGTLPASLGELLKLTDLSLASNSIEGTIPSTLGQLGRLTRLVLQSNIFEGTVPLELANCSNLVDVKLQMNTLSGDIDFLCPLGMNEKLSSDCDTGDVLCTCCTECY